MDTNNTNNMKYLTQQALHSSGSDNTRKNYMHLISFFAYYYVLGNCLWHLYGEFIK